MNGDWGTVTSDGWAYLDASVACRQLGFSSLGIHASKLMMEISIQVYVLGAVDIDRFGPGTGAIVLDNVRCLGNETLLTSCLSTIPNYDSHYRDAGVRCHPGELQCIDTFLDLGV